MLSGRLTGEDLLRDPRASPNYKVLIRGDLPSRIGAMPAARLGSTAS